MTSSTHAVVVSRRAGWVGLRVRGLVRNAELAACLRAGAPGEIHVRPDTGTVRIRVDRGLGETDWMAWVAMTVKAHERATVARRPVRPARPPVPGRAAPSDARGPRTGAQPTPAEDRPRKNGFAAADAGAAPHARRLAELLQMAGSQAPLDPAHGLDANEAARRLARDGPNEIRDITGRSTAQILGAQFSSVPVGLLGLSGALALATRAFADAGAIGLVLVANATIGFVTERRAEETVSSLRKLGPREATVLREGRAVTIDAREVVVGDILLLEPGQPVAADARVLEAHRLAANEAALTGESLPVRKEPIDTLPADTPLGERRNMVFLGTVVSGGVGRAVVVATSENAALGRIRRLAQSAEAPQTQLQQELDRLGRRLAIGAALLCVGVFGIGLLRRRPMLPLLRTAVSLGVAAIPEGLPTVATSLLATSIRSLQEHQVYARRLDAVESLGAVDTVCFDKTGTLTENRMSVASLTLGPCITWLDGSQPVPALPPAWLHVAALCNALEPAGPEGAPGLRWHGSSTEIALVDFAQSQGLDVETWRRRHPALAVRHRSEHHPYMVTLHDSSASGLLVAVKGRPDDVLARCTRWHDGRSIESIDDPARQCLLAANRSMAARGHRVLALAFRQHPQRDYGETGGLTWLGLVGLADPLRPGLPEMMRRFKAAGIRPLMITGDQLPTAQAVAEQIGLDHEQPVIDAVQLPETAAAAGAAAEHAAGFARTSPAMKLQIVRGLQQRHHVVAMTGDGINDGPALKAADVGVAMGVTGTDFAHAMSDLVLRDDHPSAMLQAIEQGRTAFLNIKKSVRYLVATNLSELAATAVAVAAGAPEPFDPLQLLWTNIATDVFPAIALGLEPAEPGVLERPPVSLRGGLLGREEWAGVATDAGVMTMGSLLSFGYGLARYGAGPHARTMAFMTLTTSQLLYALSMRSPRPLRMGGLQPNPWLRHAIGWTLLAQAATVVLPPVRSLLRTGPVGVVDLGVIAATAVLPLGVRELLKERVS